MKPPAAVKARYADWRPVKGRKVLQIVLEVPLEQQNEVLAMLGAPLPDRHLWVAIAVLSEAASETKGGKLAQQAAIMCNEGAFQQWAAHRMKDGVRTAECAADFIRWRCAVTSRADLDHDEAAGAVFRSMKSEYEAWLKVAA